MEVAVEVGVDPNIARVVYFQVGDDFDLPVEHARIVLTLRDSPFMGSADPTLVAESQSMTDTTGVGGVRSFGPVLIGTTLVIIAGLSTTLTSGLPTISLFGWIAATALAIAIVGDLVILPALMAGFARGWFDRWRPAKPEPERVPA